MKTFEGLELTQAEAERATKYEKSFGKEWVEKALHGIRAEKWMNLHLEVVSKDVRHPYNCYEVGKVTYKRKDGQPITQDDLDAIEARDFGQLNRAIGKPGDMTAVHHWECDSSG